MLRRSCEKIEERKGGFRWKIKSFKIIHWYETYYKKYGLDEICAVIASDSSPFGLAYGMDACETRNGARVAVTPFLSY